MTGLLEHHPSSCLFPLMSDEEYSQLKHDIQLNGQQEPILLFDGRILDGRNRYRACLELGVTPQFRTVEETISPVHLVVSLNLHRRHLNASQLAAISAEMLPLLEAEAKERQRKSGGNRGNQHTKKGEVPVVARLPQPALESEGKARNQAAKIVGAGSRYVSDAKKIQQQAPELLEKIKAGNLTLPQARREVRRREKREELKAKAESATADNSAQWQIVTGDCIQELRRVATERARLVFADPPYNVGVDYGSGSSADLLSAKEYVSWLGNWISECHRVLTDDGSLWVLISDEYAAECCIEIKSAGFILRDWIKWYEGFGVNCASKFNRCTRHLFHAIKAKTQFVFHEDAVSRPSDRQLKYNDARADPGGKILDDCWFDIPRLAGTHNERVPDFPTQLPVALTERIIRCASDPGDLVIDPFCGSASTGVAALRNSRQFFGIEKSAEFASIGSLRLKGEC